MTFFFRLGNNVSPIFFRTILQNFLKILLKDDKKCLHLELSKLERLSATHEMIPSRQLHVQS